MYNILSRLVKIFRTISHTHMDMIDLFCPRAIPNRYLSSIYFFITLPLLNLILHLRFSFWKRIVHTQTVSNKISIHIQRHETDYNHYFFQSFLPDFIQRIRMNKVPGIYWLLYAILY